MLAWSGDVSGWTGRDSRCDWTDPVSEDHGAFVPAAGTLRLESSLPGSYYIAYLITLSASLLTCIWLHLRCDVGLKEDEYEENCLCVTVLCTIIMVHKGTSSSYRSVDYRASILLGLALCLPSTSVSLVLMVLYIYNNNYFFAYILYFTF